MSDAKRVPHGKPMHELLLDDARESDSGESIAQLMRGVIGLLGEDPDSRGTSQHAGARGESVALSYQWLPAGPCQSA